MTASDPRQAARVSRLGWDFPDWHITHDPDGDSWCRWRAWRRVPLSEVEVAHQRRREIVADTADRLLAELGAEQRAQDILRASQRS